MKEFFLFFLVIIFAFGLIFQVQADVDPVNTQGTVEEEEAPPSAGPAKIPGQLLPPTPPVGGFRILINNGAEYTDSSVVNLKLFGGPDTARMAISNFSDFRDAGQEAYTQTKTWNLCKGFASCPEGEYTVYAKFYAPWGTASEVVSDSIIYKKPILESIIEQIKTRINEILRKIVDLRKQIAQFFKKEVVSEIPEGPPEAPPEEIVPPAKELPEEEIVSPPKEILPEKEKAGPFDFLKEYVRWVWQQITSFWQKTWPF